MKNIKRYGLIAGAVLILALAAFLLIPRSDSAVPNYDNLIVNGDFASVDANGNPSSWYLDAYDGLTGSQFSVEQEDGYSAARIVNLLPKDARFAQTVKVAPNAIYRLHGYIKSTASGGRGANLSVEGVYVFTDPVFDTEGEWTEVTLYGNTGPKQTEINVFARLGGYSGEATGEAWFRDITLCRVDAVPAGHYADDWYYETVQADTSETASQGTWGVKLALTAAAYLILFTVLFSLLRKQQDELKKTSSKGCLIALIGVLLCALAARIGIAVLIPGYDVDISCFRGWSIRMASAGPAYFYSEDTFCDYPPGYMLILWAVGGLGNLFGTGVTELMVKLPPILADLALCMMLYATAKKYGFSGKAALALVILYAFNPLVIMTGSAWGQADALMTLLLFIAVLWAVQGQWKVALPCYVAAVFFKPQALMFGPLGLIALVMHLISCWKAPEKKSTAIKDLLFGLGLTLAAAAVIVLPFSIHQQADWLITLYAKTMGSYAYATVNTCNIYFLLGQNWAPVGNQAGFTVSLLVYALAVLPLFAAAIGRSRILHGQFDDKKENLRFILLAGYSLALGAALLLLGRLGQLTIENLGTAMIVYSVAVVCTLFVLAKDQRLLPAFGAVLLVLLFNTGSMMHERYLFPAVALLLLGYILKKDTRMLWLAVGLSISGLFNVGCALDRNIRIGGAAGHLDAPLAGIKSDTAVLEYFCAALNCALSFASLYLCSVFSRGEIVSLSPEARPVSPLPEKAKIRRMTKKDWLILAVITVAYAGLTFTNLGSTKAPQTAFVSVAPDEEIVIDLGESSIFKMAYYGGIHAYDSDFTVQVSPDGEVWDQMYTAGMKIGDCFKWKYLSSYPDGSQPVLLVGRYVRITCDHYSLTLHEILFKDYETGEIIPASILSDQVPLDGESGSGEALSYIATGNDTAANLLDEQDTMEGEPGWYNSTYFDEIYHARTGYEHLHAMQTYETTHPPLGKIFMSWCIAIFGMTPFGWRFAGALAGVLMLPGMYLLGKMLGKRTWAGLAAALLMAFDLMHFTQTRIATIDSFVVLFIIWMVYFMLRWFYQDEFSLPLRRALVPLGLSGLFMGLGVASKWTACYVGVILAIIFFYGIFRRWRQVLEARDIPEKKRSAAQKETAKGGKRLLITIASCLIFFILIPLTIYYVSYIPYFAYDGVGVTPNKVIQAAVGTYFTNGQMGGMLGYHSEPGRGMDHYFYSPWYQWPVIGKPMWYSSNDFEPTGYQSSIMAMGNPAVWWVGLICILVILAVWVKRHLQKDRSLSFFVERDEPKYGFLLLLYFGQLMPWILVPRGTYIYHYFPCVPFLILAIILCLDLIADGGERVYALGPNEIDQRRPHEKLALWLMIGLVLAALALFIFFFPYASGITVKQEWMDACKWFKNWLWY